MALLPIIYAPDNRLKLKCQEVHKIDQSACKLMEDMLETMYAAPGIGLSAPQVGDNRRILVCDIAREKETPNPMKMVNPKVIWSSDETFLAEEGCLSLPQHYAEVKRPKEIRVKYIDEIGINHEVAADGLLAACIQHEIDHLDGILFVDYLSPLRRNIILRKMKKLKRHKEAA
ncbi:MAG: peptide deformylase [Alphaproteobacteria bacterium]|nr:peptide deformylase [Alphaproteobacteria bacterium]